MSLDVTLTDKKIMLEDCAYNKYTSIEELSKDSTEKKNLIALVDEEIDNNCSYWDNYEKMFSSKRSLAKEIINDSSSCRKYFTDGVYKIVGNNIPMRIVRKGNTNTVDFIDDNCKVKYLVHWINECDYYLILQDNGCNEPEISKIDTMLINIVDIQNDTIHYDIKINSNIYPQILRKVK